MGSDCYKIEVIHYQHPHLIWVEVTEPGIAKRDEIILEQIGIYGVLPLDTSIDIEQDTLKTETSREWMPATIMVMKKMFSEAVEIKFCPIHIDRRSSILDDNIHKYGEIIITNKKGKQKSLSHLLEKNGMAYVDECNFHKELCSGNLKTKLSMNQTNRVIHNIQLHYTKNLNKKQVEKLIKKQTSISQKAHFLEVSLTSKNLEAHNSLLGNDNKSLEKLLQQKFNDLKKCKDIEESVGRANSKDKSNSSSSLKKPLQLHQSKTFDSTNMFLMTKKFMDINGVVNSKEIKSHDESDFERVHDCSPTKFDNVEVAKLIETIEEDKEKYESKPLNTDKKPQSRMHKRYEKSPSSKYSEFDERTQKRVAFGPPDLNKQYLPLKVMAKLNYERPNKPNIEQQEDTSRNIDRFGDVDSDVEIDLKHLKTPQKLVISPVAVEFIEENPQTQPMNVKVTEDDSPSKHQKSASSSFLRKILCLHRQSTTKLDSSFTSASDTSNKDSSTSVEEIKRKKSTAKEIDTDSDDSISEILEQINLEFPAVSGPKPESPTVVTEIVKNHVNPFKNLDPDISVFVEKLVSPVLMVHSAMNKRFQPISQIRDVHFNSHIRVVLKNMGIVRPMRVQSVSWFAIMRGYSIFLISPKESGKTIGYLPAVCRLVSDRDNIQNGVGPSCIIVCATAVSVAAVTKLSKVFLGQSGKAIAIYTGMTELEITTSLLNGCDLLICTPLNLVRILQSCASGFDLRRLTTFVLDDCERLSEVYGKEIKFVQLKIKEMLKSRVAKEVSVQYVISSRVWCNFMEPLAKKAPNTVICISAFQECALYSKAPMSVSFVTNDNKVKTVLNFLESIDDSKKTVIVCRTGEEVEMLEKVLVDAKYVVFACDNTMTVQDLYNLSLVWGDYQDPISGPILVCCDGNLTHMNVTDAHYLVHFSLPQLFSMFCIRFSVLTDHYASIFNEENENVKVKILLEEANMEQLPKILHFIKRCTDEAPKLLEDICQKVLAEKDASKAKNLVPICDNLLALGECPDFWNCQSRHAVSKEHDDAKEWVPKSGVVTFRIIHYHNAVLYSSRLISHVAKGQTIEYPQTYNTLSMKIAMHFGKESNRKLHGTPKVGDVCAVAVKQDFFVRCQIVKILNYYQKGNPNNVLIRLIDEEKLVNSRDIYLYHLPEDMKTPETHIVQVRLANIQPKDRDITYSDLAMYRLKKITDTDDKLYMRGQIALTVGNCLFVDKLETCRDLSSMNNTIVRHDFKQELLDVHAIPNPEHIPKLEKLCRDGGLALPEVKVAVDVVKPLKPLPDARWAHLVLDELSSVYCASAENPGMFFVRLVKFENCINLLLQDIEAYVAVEGKPATGVKKGDIILAPFPDDGMYERARIDEITDQNKVRCFFVDQGDWREVATKDLVEIIEKFITQIPFQAIECRLIGVKPPGETWNEFSTHWFTNCFEDNVVNLKQLYVKYFTKETAEYTTGHKYGVVLIDTYSDEDVVINRLMIDLNLAQEDENEVKYLEELNLQCNSPYDKCSDGSPDEEEWEKISNSNPEIPNGNDTKQSLKHIFPGKPIRIVPLVDSDFEDDDDKWHVNFSKDFMSMFQPMAQKIMTNMPAIKNAPILESKPVSLSDQNSSQKKQTPMKIVKMLDSDDTTENDVKIRSDSHGDKSSIEPKGNPSELVTVLDSDDLTSPEPTQVSGTTGKTPEKPGITPDTETKIEIVEVEQLRKPKLCWRQNKDTVTIKIQLIVDNYKLEIKERSLIFDAEVYDTKYGFNLELYGVINCKESHHSNKGQYIHMTLKKLLQKNWLYVTRQGGIMKWIVYDVDSIDASSSEEEVDDLLGKVLKNRVDEESESDEDFMDDVSFRYKY